MRKLNTFFLFSVVAASSAWGQQSAPMTLPQALERARTRAPQILVAHERIEEARGRLTGASVLQQENPVVASSAGPRFSPSGDTVDVDVSLSQSFELGGRRTSRIAGARAGIERETATSRDVLRRFYAM